MTLTIATVTSRSYLPGTQVMLHSLLSKGGVYPDRIEIYQDDLEESEKDTLRSTFVTVAFPDMADDLADAIARLCADHAGLQTRMRRFFSLQAFHPHNEGRILFCDSDLLFLHNVADFLDHAGELVACADRAMLEGNHRDPDTLAESEGEDDASGFSSFNAGLMAITPAARSADRWGAILARLDPAAWASLASTHTDQAVLNLVFGRSVTLADPRYNVLAGFLTRLKPATGIRLADAKGLHFNNATKPWRFDQHSAAIASDPALIKAFEAWFAAYAQFLAAQHLAGIPAG